jgi:D-sedoheptulose 7-phosphate isomerase
MTEASDYITQHIAEHMEATAQAASRVTPALGHAAEGIVTTLLSDGRVLACGNGTTNTLAQYFCTCLLNRYEHDRPALPAINIGADATTFAAICRDSRFNETFSRQVRALGKEGDVLLVLSDDGNKANLIQAIQAAHERQMLVIVLAAGEDTDLHSLLHSHDVEITLPGLNPTMAAEVMLVLLNSLCGLVEKLLFGN